MPLLEIRSLHMNYGKLTALKDVSFSILPRKTLGVVGESGCGKSTLAKVIMQIVAPASGDIVIHGKSFTEIPKREYRRKVQMIFQDPYRSLNPRKTAIDIIAEPLYINSGDSLSVCRDQAMEMMKKVGLRPEFANRYPHMFSGGQRQRIGIARALIMRPELVICDEPVSALDVSIQAQVLNLLMDLQDEFGLTYLFISHDLSVVQHIVDDVVVMYLGKVVEYGPRDRVFLRPKHPYTQALLASKPKIRKEERNQKTKVVQGELPSMFDYPGGCVFHSRCPLAEDRCQTQIPHLEKKDEREVACYVV